MVSGGILRVECVEVNCISFIPLNKLHATLHLREDSLGLKNPIFICHLYIQRYNIHFVI